MRPTSRIVLEYVSLRLIKCPSSCATLRVERGSTYYKVEAEAKDAVYINLLAYFDD